MIPTCSVCVANYNGEKFLEACLGSILAQDFAQSVEIIVHDDCSTDNSRQFIREKFPQVITVQFVRLAPGESSINIYSRSELGSSEAEIHKDRIERWLRFMESAL